MSDNPPSSPPPTTQRAASQQEARAARSTSMRPPLWVRWVLTLVGSGALVVAVVVAIHAANRSSAARDVRAAGQADREGQAIVAADQAPRTAPVGPKAKPRIALERALRADMASRIRSHDLSGPLERMRCQTAGAVHAGRHAYRCTVGAGGVDYPFLGVVDLRARRVTWCKRDPSPSPAVDIPVSHRCRA